MVNKDCKEKRRKAYSIIRERSDLTFKGGLRLRDCGIETIFCGICVGFWDVQKNQQDFGIENKTGIGIWMKYISGLWDIQKKYAEFRTCKTNHIRIRYLSFNLRGIRYFRILFLLSRRGIAGEKDTGLRDLEPLEPSIQSIKTDCTDRRLPSK